MEELIEAFENELIMYFDNSEPDTSQLISVDDAVKMVQKNTEDKELSLCGNS